MFRDVVPEIARPVDGPHVRRPGFVPWAAMARPTYPTPPTSDQVDDYHGTVIADPYRPLEDSDAPATRAWIAAENELTATVLDRHPGASRIRERLAELWDYPRAGAPVAPRRPMVPAPEHRPPEPGRPLVGRRAGCGGHGPLRPERPERRGHDGAAVHRGVGERRARRPAPSATPGSDWRRWTVRRAATGEELPDRDRVEQVLVRRLDTRRRRLLLRPLPAAPGRCRLRRAEPRHGAPLSPARHGLGGRRAGLLDARPSRSGASSPRSRTTAAASSSRSGGAPIRRAGSTWRTWRTASSGASSARSRPGGRPLRAHRDDRWNALPPDRPRRAARPGHRRRHRRSGAGPRDHSGVATKRWSTSSSSATGSPWCTSTTPSPARHLRARRPPCRGCRAARHRHRSRHGRPPRRRRSCS